MSESTTAIRDETMEDPARRIVRRYFDMWNTGQDGVAEEVLDPGWRDHDHPEVTGPADVRRAVARIRAIRPGLRFEITAVLGAGELIAAVGRAVDEGAEAPPSDLVWLIRMRDGRMAEMWTYRRAQA